MNSSKKLLLINLYLLKKGEMKYFRLRIILIDLIRLKYSLNFNQPITLFMRPTLTKIGYASYPFKHYVVNNIVLVFLMTIINSAVFSQEKSFQLIGSIQGIDTGTIKLNSLLSDSSKKIFY